VPPGPAAATPPVTAAPSEDHDAVSVVASFPATGPVGRRRTGPRPVVSDVDHPHVQGSWQEPS
jgi:hypothetical protein